MTATDKPDLNNLPRVLDYLATKKPELAQFAQLLIDDGGEVLDVWGPLQMSVWHLEVRRGNWLVRFHSERGFVEWACIARATNPEPKWDDFHAIGLAIFAWARANGVPFRIAGPDDLEHGMVAYGRDALDWLDQGHDESLERVFRAWYAYRHAKMGLDGDALRAVQADAVGVMEAAAEAAAGG